MKAAQEASKAMKEAQEEAKAVKKQLNMCMDHIAKLKLAVEGLQSAQAQAQAQPAPAQAQAQPAPAQVQTPPQSPNPSNGVDDEKEDYCDSPIGSDTELIEEDELEDEEEDSK